jgi:hypothetical protein
VRPASRMALIMSASVCNCGEVAPAITRQSAAL